MLTPDQLRTSFRLKDPDLSDEVWRMISEIVATGQATFSNGTIYVPKGNEIVQIFKLVAGLKLPPQDTMSLEGFSAQRTGPREQA